MKKRNIMVALLCSMCLAVSSPIPAMADGTKVVTLGADLTQDQKNTMMNYFKADSSQVQVTLLRIRMSVLCSVIMFRVSRSEQEL